MTYNAALSYRAIGPTLGPAPHHHGHTHDVAYSHAASSGPVVDLVLELNGEWSEKQDEGGERDDNSGGTVVYSAPGLRVGYERVSGFASIGIPLITDLNGVQAEPDYRINTGFSVALP